MLVKAHPVKALNSSPPTYETHPVKIEPWNLCFYPSDTLLTEKVEFEIINLTAEDLALTQVSWVDTMYEFSFPDTIPAADTAIGTVYANEETYVYGVRKSVTFELSDSDTTRFTIPVTGAASSYGESEPCPDEDFHF